MFSKAAIANSTGNKPAEFISAIGHQAPGFQMNGAQRRFAHMPDLARKFLESLHRFDLSMLLGPCETEILKMAVSNDWLDDIFEEVVVVRAPVPIDDALNALPQADRKRIAEAVASKLPTTKSHDDLRIESLPGPASEGAVALLAELLIHRGMMVSVATGGDRIQDVNDYYIAREARIRERLPPDVAYDNPHGDLWAWYHHWSGKLPQYKDRRLYVRELFSAAIAALSKRSRLPSPQRDSTGWERVDRALSKARSQFELASAEEDYQAIGLLCREVIISLAQAVYDPTVHESMDGVVPSATDANRMLEAYVGHVFPGDSYKEVRAHHRASLALTLNLQHRRTATLQLAALCVEATASTVAVVSIIARSPAA